MTRPALPEVSEGEAAGRVAEIYAEIRATLRVPVVNLIYRHLAAEPERLEAVWAALRPNLADARTHALALELVRIADRVRPDVARLTPSELAAAGVAPGEHALARATLAVYERANALNLLAVGALVGGCSGSDGTELAAPVADAPAGDILPMADPAALDGATRELLDRMSAAAVPAGGDVLTPSLYRHLASSPALLRAVWEAVAPALTAAATARASDVVRGEARRLAAGLPHRVERAADPGVRAVLERFAPAIASMLVAGRAIDVALGGPGR